MLFISPSFLVHCKRHTDLSITHKFEVETEGQKELMPVPCKNIRALSLGWHTKTAAAKRKTVRKQALIEVDQARPGLIENVLGATLGTCVWKRGS